MRYQEARSMVSPQHTTNEGPSQPARPNFAFVSDETQHGVRSHAMRQHWRRRQQRLGAEERKQEADSLNDRVILPRPLENSNIAESNDADFNSAESYQLSRTRSGSDNAPDKGKQVVSSKHNPGEHGLGPVPENFPEALGNPVLSQAISGMKSALASCKLDPFDSFPIKLTAQHHQLLHHWLVMYSTMIFDRLETAYFNPIRDVWLPMDLSNAASFNAIMAHSAAHLAHMRGSRNLRTALKYKTEAIRMVAEWMSDPKLCLSDNIIAAVLRLLTYERYWGTEAEWRVHLNGLLRLVGARGGIEALHSNWRVSLVAYLVSLMNGPSWFDTSNRIWEISTDQGHEWVKDNLHRIRCLWLLSFIQDIRIFASLHRHLYANRMVRFPVTIDILEVLQARSRPSSSQPTSDDQAPFDDHAFRRLACLLLICVLIYKSFLEAEDAGSAWGGSGTHSLSSLESLLDRYRSSWQQGSVDGLYDIIFHIYLNADHGERESYYVLSLARTLGSLSSEARWGVENCLLYVVCQARGPSGEEFLDGDERTPDYLLASIHGD